MTDWSWRYSITTSSVQVADANGKYTAKADIDNNNTNDTVGVELEAVDDKGACNDPKITFVNKLTKTPWLDGNSPKVVNTAGNATAAIVGKTASISDTYANFKREETLI